MRSLAVSMVVGLVVSTMAATGSAGEPAPKPAARPRIELAPQVRVTGFHRASGQVGPYAGGALALAVDVENTSAAAVEGIVVKVDAGDHVLEATLTIPARATRTALLTDAEGLASSCKPKPYTVTLAGTGTAGASREAHVTPSCTFTSTVEETWNLMSPDRVEAHKAGNVYLTAPAIVSAPACGKGPTMKARIVSRAAASSPSIIVQAKEWSGSGQVKAQTAAAFPLASGEQKDLVLASTPGGDFDVPAKMKLAIVDWTKSLGGHTDDGGIFVNTTRSCTLDVGLE